MKFRILEKTERARQRKNTNNTRSVHQPGTFTQVSDVAKMLNALRVLVNQLMQMGTDRQRAHAQPQPEHQARDGRLH